MTRPSTRIVVRTTWRDDFAGIARLTEAVYPGAPPWNEQQLSSHLDVFPEGQFVAVEEPGGRIVGMAASLVLLWDEYQMHMNWRDFTDHGMFTNHDAENGHTLYGAEVMVDPAVQRRGIGKRLYLARRGLVERLGLLRIRAGARLRGYHRHAKKMSPDDYVTAVVEGRLKDATLSFQLREGFKVISVVSEYLKFDPESQGYAAVIEWLNPAVAAPEDYERQARSFQLPPHEP